MFLILLLQNFCNRDVLSAVFWFKCGAVKHINYMEIFRSMKRKLLVVVYIMSHYRRIMLVSMGRMFQSVCLSVCFFVCLQHNSKTNDPRVFKFGVENDLEVVLFWGSKVKGQGHRISKFILHTRTLHRTAINRHSLGGITSRRRGFEIGIECLLVLPVVPCFCVCGV